MGFFEDIGKFLFGDTEKENQLQNQIDNMSKKLSEISDPSQYNDLLKQLEALKDNYKKNLVLNGIVDQNGKVKDPQSITSFMKEQGIIDKTGKLKTNKGIQQFYKDQGLTDSSGNLIKPGGIESAGQKQGFLDSAGKYVKRKGLETIGQEQGFVDANGKIINPEAYSEFYKKQNLVDNSGQLRTAGNYNQKFGVTDINGNVVEAKDVQGQYVDKNVLGYLQQRRNQQTANIGRTVTSAAKQQELQGQGARNLANEAMLTEQAQRNIQEGETQNVNTELQRAKQEAASELSKRLQMSQTQRANEQQDIAAKSQYAGTQAQEARSNQQNTQQFSQALSSEEAENRAQQISTAGKLSDDEWRDMQTKIDYAKNLTAEERQNYLDKMNYAVQKQAEALQNYMNRMNIATNMSADQRNQVLNLINAKLSINGQAAGANAAMLQNYQTQLANQPDGVLNQILSALANIGGQYLASKLP